MIGNAATSSSHTGEERRPGRIYVGGSPSQAGGAPMLLPPMPQAPMPAQSATVTPADPAHASARVRYRVRWENIATAGLALAAVVSTIFWAAQLGDDAPAGSVAVPQATEPLGPSEAAIGEAAHEAQMDGLSDAMATMRRARALMGRGDLDRARTVLDSLPLEFVADLRADDLLDEVDALIRQRDDLSDRARTQIRSGQWAGALASIRRIAGFSVLPADLAEAKASVTRRLAISQRKQQVRRLLDAGKPAEALELARRSRDAYGATFDSLLDEAKAAASAAQEHERRDDADQPVRTNGGGGEGSATPAKNDRGSGSGVGNAPPATSGGGPAKAGTVAADPPGAATGRAGDVQPPHAGHHGGMEHPPAGP